MADQSTNRASNEANVGKSSMAHLQINANTIYIEGNDIKISNCVNAFHSFSSISHLLAFGNLTRDLCFYPSN